MAPLELGALEPELLWLMELALLWLGWLGECGGTGIVVWSSRRAQTSIVKQLKTPVSVNYPLFLREEAFCTWGGHATHHTSQYDGIFPPC